MIPQYAHIKAYSTLRDPVQPDTFWVNPFGVAFSLIKKSDLIQVDHEGNVIDGGEVRLLNAAAFMIHGAVHKARPDVLCAAHSHVRGNHVPLLSRKTMFSTLTNKNRVFTAVRFAAWGGN